MGWPLSRSLESVWQYNQRKAEEHRVAKLELTGVLCPVCEKNELKWVGPMLASLPPKRGVECTGDGCHYATQLVL